MLKGRYTPFVSSTAVHSLSLVLPSYSSSATSTEPWNNYSTFISPLKMSHNHEGKHSGSATADKRGEPVRPSWNDLHLDIRLAIWGYLYTATPSRIVEIHTTKHKHHSSLPTLSPHVWCPRGSASPAPLVVNICWESRIEARRLAIIAGHLLFSDSDSGVYFNPVIDTLYVSNDKDHWIRDWGPEGVLTQIKSDTRCKLIRSLAIEIDPLNRATTWGVSLEWDMVALKGLEELIFVVKKVSGESIDLTRDTDQRLRSWASNDRQVTQDEGFYQRRLYTFRNYPQLLKLLISNGPRSYPKGCRLAIRRGAQLELVDEELTTSPHARRYD